MELPRTAMISIYCLMLVLNVSLFLGEVLEADDHVCTTVNVSQTRYVTRPHLKVYFSKENCHNGSSSGCPVRMVYKSVMRIESETLYRTKNVCCSGYKMNEVSNSCEVCKSGTYGQDCAAKCSCPENSVCHHVNGSCSCKPGWTGDTCDQLCPAGMYGNSCLFECACPETAYPNCNHATGTCLCRNGWKGENCNQECPSGSYGRGCQAICLCENNSTCDHVNGTCACTVAGWTGKYCEKECPKRTFGVNCSATCDCPDNTDCSTKDGRCICPAGKYGEKCQEAMKSATESRKQPAPILSIMIGVVGIVILAIILVLVIGFISTKKKKIAKATSSRKRSSQRILTDCEDDVQRSPYHFYDEIDDSVHVTQSNPTNTERASDVQSSPYHFYDEIEGDDYLHATHRNPSSTECLTINHPVLEPKQFKDDGYIQADCTNGTETGLPTMDDQNQNNADYLDIITGPSDDDGKDDSYLHVVPCSHDVTGHLNINNPPEPEQFEVNGYIQAVCANETEIGLPTMDDQNQNNEDYLGIITGPSHDDVKDDSYLHVDPCSHDFTATSTKRQCENLDKTASISSDTKHVFDGLMTTMCEPHQSVNTNNYKNVLLAADERNDNQYEHLEKTALNTEQESHDYEHLQNNECQS